MSIFDDLEEKKDELCDISERLEGVIKELESIDDDYEKSDIRSILKDVINDLNSINNEIY